MNRSAHFFLMRYMVENITDLRDRLLKKDGKILPGKFEVFIEPVKLKDADTVPFIWEQDLHGIKYDCLDSYKQDMKTAYGCLLIRPAAVDHLLSEPERILYFDLEKNNAGDIPKKIKINRKITKPGRLDGFCLYSCNI